MIHTKFLLKVKKETYQLVLSDFIRWMTWTWMWRSPLCVRLPNEMKGAKNKTPKATGNEGNGHLTSGLVERQKVNEYFHLAH